MKAIVAPVKKNVWCVNITPKPKPVKKLLGRCGCGKVAVRMLANAPVCQTCLEIERKLYGKAD